MAGSPGGREDKTISDLLRNDALGGSETGAQTLELLRSLAAAVVEGVKNTNPTVDAMLGSFSLDNDGSAKGDRMKPMQPVRAPERMAREEAQQESAIATKEMTPEAVGEAAVAGLQHLIKEAFEDPHTENGEDVEESTGAEAAGKQENAEVAAAQKEFALFDFG
jgi:hypothetical protein